MSQKVNRRQKSNITKTEMSPKLKCHKNCNVTTPDYEATNNKYFELHYHCEECEEDFNDKDDLEQHILFESHSTDY